MENKINLVEILKDCPQGMRLNCTMFDDVVFEKLDFSSPKYPIVIKRTETNTTIYLTKYGQYYSDEDSKCVIFPEGNITWEGFQRPFRNGDIIITEFDRIAIIKEPSGEEYNTHVLMVGNNLIPDVMVRASRLATEEEKQELFQVIKNDGYKWNAETKTLEELIKPKFKVGDRVRHKTTNKDAVYEISKIYDDSYGLVGYTWMLYMSFQDQYELVPDKFDINTLKPFESKVLVRDSNNNMWQPSFWGYYKGGNSYNTVRGAYNQCIPYEGNEHLLGTKDDCEEQYKTWE